MLLYQSRAGAWPKNTDLLAPPTAAVLAAIERDGRADTIDNGATILPLRLLARVADATGGAEYRAAVLRGVDYLLASQYANGGFPQFYPLREGYYSHITYNDDAMVNALTALRDVAEGRSPFGFVDAGRRARALSAVARGIDCILKTQVRQGGRLTAWCAQHDGGRRSAWARAYDPPSLSGNESVGIVRFLMSVENPSPEIVSAVEAATAWFRAVPITGQRLDRISATTAAPNAGSCRSRRPVAVGPLLRARQQSPALHGPPLRAGLRLRADRLRAPQRLRLPGHLARRPSRPRLSRVAREAGESSSGAADRSKE